MGSSLSSVVLRQYHMIEPCNDILEMLFTCFEDAQAICIIQCGVKMTIKIAGKTEVGSTPKMVRMNILIITILINKAQGKKKKTRVISNTR